MKQTPMRSVAARLRSQSGYSLIELSIAMVIALFLLGGLFSILQTTRKTSVTQTALAQLQDNERIAMTLIAETIQSAGYFPNPLATSAIVALPAASPFQAGQAITGTTGGTSTTPDTITVRFQADPSGQVWGCLGTSDSQGTAHTYKLLVQNDSGSTTTSLYCAKDGATNPTRLVPNVSNLKVFYGVDTTGTGTGINSYIQASDMTNALWLNVYTVSVALTFSNPLLNQPGQSNAGQTAAPAITFTRVVPLMLRMGGNNASFN
jgi:type IV pilus assembly protein PilW